MDFNQPAKISHQGYYFQHQANHLHLYSHQLPTPWLKIFTSPAVWAIAIANFCYGWGYFTLLTCMPTYFKQALPYLQINNQVSV